VLADLAAELTRELLRGSETNKLPRISPPGNVILWIFR